MRMRTRMRKLMRNDKQRRRSLSIQSVGVWSVEVERILLTVIKNLYMYFAEIIEHCKHLFSVVCRSPGFSLLASARSSLLGQWRRLL